MQSKANQENLVLKSKERYEQKSNELMELQQFLHTSPPSKETDKARHKAEKVYQQVRQADQEYILGTEKLMEVHQNWKNDMTSACVVCKTH